MPAGAENCARHNGLSARSKFYAAVGLFLLVLAAYVLSSPGRIDIIDGQARFDVSYNLVVQRRPVITDPWLSSMAVGDANGVLYSHYGAPASVIAVPLVWIGLQEGHSDRELSRFLFSLTSPIFGAGISVVLFLFFLELGVSVTRSLLWVLVSTFATLVWPTATSTFDNAQHAFFAITTLYLGFLSARRGSALLAAAAGLAAAVLIMYQEYFLLIVPALGLSTLSWKNSDNESTQNGRDGPSGPRLPRFLATVVNDFRSLYDLHRAALRHPGEERASYLRFLTYLIVAVTTGFLAVDVYNKVRFGSYFDNGKMIYAAVRGFPMFGNPLAGFSILLLSPGKSVLLYSPPLIVGILGFSHLRRRNRALAGAIAVTSVLLVAFLSSIAFAGGDWCWGPRYLVVLLPLWALAFPYIFDTTRFRRGCIVFIVALGAVVQLLALSVEHQRFFFERGLRDFFWEDSSYYFKHSALFARVGEALSLRDGPPPKANLFNASPADWCTYTILGTPTKVPRKFAPQWMRQFKLFYLPRPWPFWMLSIPPARRPINLSAWIAGLFTTGILGLGFIYQAFRGQIKERVPQALAAEQEAELP